MLNQCLSGKYLWKCGKWKGFSKRDSGELYLNNSGKTGYFVSCIYDSGKKGMQWNRIKLDISGSVMGHIYVWLFDERSEGEEADGYTTVEDQFHCVKQNAQYYSDYRDMLLYGKNQGEGRFARFAVEMVQGDERGDRLFQGYSLSFPKESFTEYLPEIYQNNKQLERFLAVHQNIYLELEDKIDTLAEKMDYINCGKKQAERLARWMGWGDLAAQADAKTLCRLLGSGLSLISQKGTCDYYRKLTGILFGEKTVILEESEKCKATVLILNKPAAGREKYLDWLRRNVPIGVDIEFKVLEYTDRLDGLFFLDRTAMVSKYESELVPWGVDPDGIRLL